MASYLPCVKNNAAGYIFYVGLVSQASTLVFQANPTLAAGDVKIAIDDGAPANLGTLPSVDADFTKRVKVTLSQAETNGDNLTIIFSDAAGAEWCDLIINIHTATQTFDSTDTVADGVKAKTDLIGASVALETGGILANIHDTDLPAVKTDTAAILADTGTDGVVVAAASKTGYALSAAGIQAIWDALLTSLTTVGSIGKKLADWVVGTIDTYTGNTKQTGDAFARLGAPAGASVSADIAAVKGDTAAILADTGTDGVVVAAASKTGYALSTAGIQAIWDALTSTFTTVGSIGKKLADWVVGTIDTYTGNTKQTGDTFARLGAPIGASISADLQVVDGNVDAVKAKTDLIGASVALETGGILANIHDTDLPAVKTDTAAILADTGTDGVVVAAASKTGYALAQGALGIAHITLIDRIYEMINNKMNVTDATGVVALRNIADTSTIATGSVTDDLTTTVRAGLTWA
jgi:tetrahydromethanopterin S-methyltransferase subunit F